MAKKKRRADAGKDSGIQNVRRRTQVQTEEENVK